MLVSHIYYFIASFFNFLLRFRIILPDDFFSCEGRLAVVAVARHSYSSPASEEVAVVIWRFSYFQSLNDKKFVVIFG